MPTTHSARDADFQRALREFEREESARLFGEQGPDSPATERTGPLAMLTADERLCAADDAPESLWSQWRTTLLDPSLPAIACGLLVWIGLGTWAIRSFGTRPGDLSGELAAARATAEQASREVTNLKATLAAAQAQATQAELDAQESRGQVALLQDQLDKANVRNTVWSKCTGGADAAGLVQIAIPQADGPALTLCVAAPPDMAAALRSGNAPDKAATDQFVSSLLQRLGHPVTSQAAVTILAIPQPDSTSASPPPEILYVYDFERTLPDGPLESPAHIQFDPTPASNQNQVRPE